MSRNIRIFISEQYRQELKKYMDEHLERYENYQDSWNNEAGIMMMKNSLKPGKFLNT